MYKNAPRESCTQRLHRLEDKLHQLSKSLKMRKRKTRSTTPPSAVDTLKPFEMAARSLRAQQKAAIELVIEKGGVFVDCEKSGDHLPTGMESDEDSMDDLWETLTWISTPPTEGKTKLRRNEYDESADDMLGMFVWSNILISEEDQTIVEVSKDDYELPLFITCTQDSSTREKKRPSTSTTDFNRSLCGQERNHHSIESCDETVVTSNIAEIHQDTYH